MSEPRPNVTDEFLLEQGVPKEHLNEVREELEADLDACQARGPVSFSFGPESLGTLQGYHVAKGEGVQYDAVGDIDVATYTQLFAWEVHHPSPEVMANNPIEAIGVLEVIGATDEVLAAIASREKVESISVHGLVTEEDVAQAWEEHRQAEGDIADQIASGDLEPEMLASIEALAPKHRAGGARLSDAALRTLAHRTQLVDLSLTGTAFTDEALAEVLPTLPNLTAFKIGSDQISGAFVKSLGDLPLVAIVVAGQQVDGAQFNDLPVFAEVVSLAVLGDNVYDGLDADKLRTSFPNLTHLRVGPISADAAPDDRILPFLVKFPGVEVNGMTLAPKAVAKWAAKRGLTLPEE